jgi:acyl-CoA thioesterase-1
MPFLLSILLIALLPFTFVANTSASPSTDTDTDTDNILIIGDSLSAGYGIQIHESWPVLLQNDLTANQHPYKVYNASISGQTSSEGVRQTNQLLALTQPRLVVIELGANDGLRGLSIVEMEKNLQAMISKSLMARAKVLLVGIKVPANYGRRYSAMFEASFTNLAASNDIAFEPFMLAPLLNVITANNRSEYIQADGLHPTAKAQPLILKHLQPKINAILGL